MLSYVLKTSLWLAFFSFVSSFDLAASLNRSWEDPETKKTYTLPLQRSLEDKEPVNVLAIDGGGVRGIIPAKILQKIEEESKKPIAELFDLIVGTSTGGILTLGLTTPDITKETLSPKYSAKDMVNFYEKEAENIFFKPDYKKIIANTLPEAVTNGIRVGEGLIFGPSYDAGGLETTLKKYFGSMPLSFSLSNVAITAVEISNNNRLHLFRSSYAQRDRGYDFIKVDVARATSAAPTYFPPVRIKPIQDTTHYDFIDGGLGANCPSLVAYYEAERLFGTNRPINLISVGTGMIQKAIDYETAIAMGLVGWARASTSILFDTQTAQSLRTTERLLSTRPKSKFYRFQSPIKVADLDNTDPNYLKDLGKEAYNMMGEKTKKSELKEAISYLLKAHNKKDKGGFCSLCSKL